MGRCCIAIVLAALPGCGLLLGLEDPPAASIDDAHGACTLDTDCAAHEYCTTERTCECVAGYTRDGAACSWSGVVHAPGFDDPGAWTTNLATLDPTSSMDGTRDPGLVTFAAVDSCAGFVSQNVTMPRYSRAEPLVVITSHRSGAGASSTFPNTIPTGMALGLGQAWTENIARTELQGWVTSRTCLGAGHFAPESSTGFGVDTVLTFARPERAGGIFSNADCNFAFDLDHLDIQPALPGECAEPNTAANGDADTDASWKFGVTSNHSGTATAGFAANVGDNNSRAGRLDSPDQCDFMWMTAPLSVGLTDATGSPRLSFYMRGSANRKIATHFAANRLETITGRGATPTIARYCVPAPMRGTASYLALVYNGGVCDTPSGETIIDSIHFDNDATCGTDPYIADASFDADYTLPFASATTGATATKTFDPALVHAGRGAVQLSYTSDNASASVDIHITTPPHDPDAGPALTYWYRVAGTTMNRFSVRLDGITTTPPATTTWTQATQCLDPTRTPGREQKVTFSFACATACALQQASAFVDDLAVTTSETCPN